MRADLERRAGYGDLIDQIMKNDPNLTEAKAIEHFQTVYYAPAPTKAANLPHDAPASPAVVFGYSSS
jgi:hypothetical protein